MIFWYLVFAHLLADYPLQPTWMVVKKARWTVLVMHVGIHFSISAILLLPVVSEVWTYLLALTGIHFILDIGKSQLGQAKPKWVIGPYLIDQLIHLLTLFAIAILVHYQVGELPIESKPIWLILSIVLLLITYVWFISERIFFYKQPDYRQEIINNLWPRMASRSLFLALFLFLSSLIVRPAALLGITLQFPYSSSKFRDRALITDILVSVSGSVLFLFFISI